MNYLSVESISKSYGARTLFREISFGIDEGQKVALIARNGTGKTSLLSILSGDDQPDAGRVTFRKNLKVGYLSQDPGLKAGRTILESVLAVDNDMTRAITGYEKALEKPEDTEAYQKAFDDMDRFQAWDFEAQVKQILGKLGLQDQHLKVDHLSGGQRKRVALAKTLISTPDILILDEPTNHLDVEMIEWLEEYLSQPSITLFMVTHDRYFMENICDQIFELEGQTFYQHPGNFSSFLERKAEREEISATNTDKARNLMRKELEWIRRQPKARGTKSKARIDAFHDLKDKASHRVKDEKLELDIKMTRLGSKILELHRLRKSYGDLKIVDGFDYTFKRKERVGVIGKNGVGKSTFLRLLTGEEEPTGGKIVTGETIEFGFYTQRGIQLDEDKRVIEVVKEIAEYIPIGKKGRNITASQMLERFLFEGDHQYTYVSKLSGGERRRLYLLTILMKNPNFLILDEPTNDLDILTLNVLEDFLMEFGGCLIVVTHDRYFMDKLTDHLFVFEGDGHIRDFPGNYTEYTAAKAREEELEKIRSKSMAKSQAKPSESKDEKTKLTYAERLEMEELEKQLGDLEARKAEIAGAFEEAITDAERLESLSREMNEINAAIEEKEMRWLELSEYE
ncbi:MAG: ABC transporter [Owenweeksia sp.]|nr:ABC transporter [Owenweeksia sp.]MBF99270.1 ABC transporter [Owenweeksia sp.]